MSPFALVFVLALVFGVFISLPSHSKLSNYHSPSIQTTIVQPDNDEGIPLTRIWKFPGFFHFTSDYRIEGVVAVKYDEASRVGLFNFRDSTQWTLDPTMNLFRHHVGCSWCSDEVEPVCYQNGIFYAQKQEGGHGPLKNVQAQLIRTRPYSFNQTEYAPRFHAISLSCTFNFSLERAQTSHGFLLLHAQPHFRVKTNLRAAAILKKGESESVVCGRNMFGGLTSRALLRFSRFYLDHWKMSKVIVYNVGLGNPSSPELRHLIATNRLIVLDFRAELERVYGHQWFNMVLFMGGVFQIFAKADCVNRAKSLGVAWTLHMDFDEFLFAAGTGQRFPSFASFMENQYPAAPVSTFLSLPVIHLPQPNSKLCGCYQNAFVLDEFVREGELTHERELARYAADPFPGPFLFKKGQWNKVKILLRLDVLEFQTYSLGLHWIKPNLCAFRDPVSHDCVPYETNTDSFLYLREYTCINAMSCDDDDDDTEEEWWQ